MNASDADLRHVLRGMLGYAEEAQQLHAHQPGVWHRHRPSRRLALLTLSISAVYNLGGPLHSALFCSRRHVWVLVEACSSTPLIVPNINCLQPCIAGGNASSTATAAGASAKAQPVPDLKRKAHAEAEQPNKAPKLSFKPPDPSAPAARGTMLAKACTTKPKHYMRLPFLVHTSMLSACASFLSVSQNGELI